MRRREFLGLLAAAQRKQESVTASASYDTVPQVAIVLSSFTGSEDHDGAKVDGLKEPGPVDAELTAAQVDAMVRRAVDLARFRRGGLSSIVEPEDWVLVKVAAGTDRRVVESVLGILAAAGRGQRFTVAGLAAPAELARRYPKLEFDALDLAAEESPALPLPGHPDRVYRVPKAIQRCDRLISIAALGPLGAVHNAVARPSEETLIDLYRFHPADYALIGSARPNLIIAGASATAVDAVAAAVRGLDPARLPYLAALARAGFGSADLEVIWTRGNTLEQARREFLRAKGEKR